MSGRRVGIVGLGYVGLPLAMEFCRAGHMVVGVDIDAKRIDVLQRGASHIGDVPGEDVAHFVRGGRFFPTCDYSALAQVDAMSVCVPTPLGKAKNPDVSFVVRAIEGIVEHLHPGQLVILESTVYPGATDELVAPILERKGLKAGIDFYLAFSPERIDPGNRKYFVSEIPKLVGGINKASTEKAVELYRAVFQAVIPMESAREAEMAKLLENTFRLVNIGLVNELAVIAYRMGINIWRVIEAASTKPFGFMPFYPGPGLGGHCIPVDPYYLSWRARVDGIEAGFIEHAGIINDRMPAYVLERLTDLLNERGKTLQGSRILLLGVTYKKNVADVRESPALSIITLLEKKKATITYHDLYVPLLVHEEHKLESQPLTAELLRNQDCVLILTDHSNIDYDFVVANSHLVFDTRNATIGVQHKNPGKVAVL